MPVQSKDNKLVSRIYGGSGGTPVFQQKGRNTMRTKTVRQTAAIFLAVLTCFVLLNTVFAEAAMPLIGEWAFDYEPETTVLKVDADGTAWYKGTEYRWEDQGTSLKLTDAEGKITSLRYTVTEEKKVIYPQTRYQRGKEVEGQGGLIGIWEGVDDKSNFVFTPAGYFLEDSSFTGNFMFNSEEGTFLLHYGDVFDDTTCYYSIQDEILTVEYPWTIVEKKP